ncbi:MAG: PA2169 family four-helix-bundle protein [Anaerolineae bacterium]|nr:PA2169 family four-helix-bundle protein [Anaerolineae bacterium]
MSTITNQEIITEVNHLIELCLDGQLGNLQAVEVVKQPAFASVLREHAREHEEFVKELANIVVSLGGEPANTQDATGDVHHAWLNIRAFKEEGNEAAVIEECVAGEKATLAAYHKALKKSLPDYAEKVIQQQAEQISYALERIRDLRNTVQKTQ